MSRQRNLVNYQSRPRQLGALASYFVVFALMFTSLRGWVVLNLNAPTEIVYSFSAVLTVALAMYGFSSRFKIKDGNLTLLRNLLLVNLLLGIYYVVGTKLLGGSIDVTIFYLYALPYIVFLYLRISAKRLHVGLFFIFAGISFSVVDNFIISLSGTDGLAYLQEYNMKLRPLVFEGMSRTGDYLRSGGYTGSYHDSANILGMLGSYYYVKSIIERNWLLTTIGLIALAAMTLTQSAANIVLALLTCFSFTIYIAVRKPTVRIGIMLFGIMILVSSAVSIIPEFLIFSARIGSDGDWDNMRRGITWEIFLSLNFWFGYGSITSSESVDTEVAFLSGILNHGIFSACVLYWVLIFPLHVFFARKSRSLAPLSYLAAIVFGFLSLAHYGSLFRVTNIAVFYTVYALFFSNIIADKEDQLRVS